METIKSNRLILVAMPQKESKFWQSIWCHLFVVSQMVFYLFICYDIYTEVGLLLWTTVEPPLRGQLETEMSRNGLASNFTAEIHVGLRG